MPKTLSTSLLDVVFEQCDVDIVWREGRLALKGRGWAEWS